MSPALSALKRGAEGLLVARGCQAGANLLREAELEAVGEPQEWQMGADVVSAQSMVLVVEATAFVRLEQAPQMVDAVRDALDAAMRSQTTRLGELRIALRLPEVQMSWASTYRTSARRYEAEELDAGAVQAGAGQVLEAMGEEDEAGLLARSRLELAALPASDGGSLWKAVVVCNPSDFALVTRHSAVEARISSAVSAAGRRALSAIATIEFGASATDVELSGGSRSKPG